VPYWARDPKIAYKTINARAETVATAPAFREAFKRRRCLVPANGFYE
jgi:putative SOS response-associated peptidase YedK